MEPIKDAQEPDKSLWRPKKCPACQTPVKALHLSVYGTPPEQIFIPWLRMINKNAGLSIRTFGQSGLHELQFLAFTNVCSECGHISWWDLSVEELEAVAEKQVPGVFLYWGSNPKIIENVIEKLPDDAKVPFKRFLEAFKQDE